MVCTWVLQAWRTSTCLPERKCHCWEQSEQQSEQTSGLEHYFLFATRWETKSSSPLSLILPSLLFPISSLLPLCKSFVLFNFLISIFYWRKCFNCFAFPLPFLETPWQLITNWELSISCHVLLTSIIVASKAKTNFSFGQTCTPISLFLPLSLAPPGLLSLLFRYRAPLRENIE